MVICQILESWRPRLDSQLWLLWPWAKHPTSLCLFPHLYREDNYISCIGILIGMLDGILCSRSYKANVKMSTGLGYYLEDLGKNLVRLIYIIKFLAVAHLRYLFSIWLLAQGSLSAPWGGSQVFSRWPPSSSKLAMVHQIIPVLSVSDFCYHLEKTLCI